MELIDNATQLTQLVLDTRRVTRYLGKVNLPETHIGNRILRSICDTTKYP